MTAQDYKNKVAELDKLSEKLNRTQSENDAIMELIADITLYECNNGIIKDSDFKD